jgi:hypothetical protein
MRANVKDDKVFRYFPEVLKFRDEDGKINWNIIHRFMPSNLERNIKKEYNMLNVNEIRLCCLLFFNVPRKTITKILPYQQNSITPILFRIKQKTGITNINEIFRWIILNMI